MTKTYMNPGDQVRTIGNYSYIGEVTDTIQGLVKMKITNMSNEQALFSHLKSIVKARAIVQNWDDQQKNRVRADCDYLDEMTRRNDTSTIAPVSANLAFIVENCFPKDNGTDVSTNQIRALLSQ